jgi:hypothetical protein
VADRGSHATGADAGVAGLAVFRRGEALVGSRLAAEPRGEATRIVLRPPARLPGTHELSTRALAVVQAHEPLARPVAFGRGRLRNDRRVTAL